MFRRFFDAGAAQGGGAGLPPSLQDVLGDSTTDTSGGIDPEKRSTDLSSIVAPGTSNPFAADNPPVAAGAGGAPADPTKVGGDAPAEGADPNAPPPPVEEPGEVTYEGFISDLEKITGKSYKVEIPQDVDPLSPEAFAIREKVIRDTAMDEYEEFLEKTNPRAFAYYLHTQSGKPDSEFFASKSEFSLPTSEQLSESADLQSRMYKYALTSKGLDDDAAQTLVDKAIQQGNLAARAENVRKTVEQEQLNDIKKVQADYNARLAAEHKLTADTQALLHNTISKLEGYHVPEAEQSKVQEFIWNHLQITPEGKMLIVQEVDPANIHKQVGGLLYQYMKGDLSKLVQRKAETIAAQSLAKRNSAAIKGAAASSSGTSGSKTFVPLASVE